MPTQEQYNVSKQAIQNKYIKIELLNFDFLTVDELSGNCIGGNINIDANADIRRTCYVELVVTDSSFNVESGSKIWLDKYIRIYVGIDNIMTGDITWFNQGIYLIDAPSYDYDSATHTLHFSGLDLMSKMTGQRNGYLEGIPTVIPQGSNVREAIIQTITQLGGFVNYVVDECRLRDGTIQDVPNDIVIDGGSTVYDVLVALRDIMPYYQMYFDVDGTFIYNQIPTGEYEIIVADDDLFKDTIISESINTDFASVKNEILVYGRDGVEGYAIDDNPDSPFNYEDIGVIRKVFFGGEFDNITTSDLANERAQYELYQATRMQDSVTWEMIPVYWFEMNQVVEHTPRGQNKPVKYIIKSISFELNPLSTMTLNAIKYYSPYQTITRYFFITSDKLRFMTSDDEYLVVKGSP